MFVDKVDMLENPLEGMWRSVGEGTRAGIVCIAAL